MNTCGTFFRQALCHLDGNEESILNNRIIEAQKRFSKCENMFHEIKMRSTPELNSMPNSKLLQAAKFLECNIINAAPPGFYAFALHFRNLCNKYNSLDNQLALDLCVNHLRKNNPVEVDEIEDNSMQMGYPPFCSRFSPVQMKLEHLSSSFILLLLFIKFLIQIFQPL